MHLFSMQLHHLMEIKTLKPLHCIKSSVKEINRLDFLMLIDLPEDSPHFNSDNFRSVFFLAVVNGTLCLLVERLYLSSA